MRIGSKEINQDTPAFIIAELSANHGNDFEISKKTIAAMKESGADAVKVQTYTADTITINSDKKDFWISQGTIWDGKNLHKLYEEAAMPWEWQPKLKKFAEELGLIFFSSPFDKTAVDFLEEMDVPAYKVASFEITDIPLIEYVARKQKPVIMSTGIAELSEIEEAINACHRMGNNDVILLKCTSGYPAPYEEMNLLTIADMKVRFDALVGLSDHSLGIEIPVAAVALGAKIIEKHFILERTIGGADASFSLEPAQFKQMVDVVRNTEQALGKINYDLSEKSKRSREFSRSLYAVQDIKKGEKYTEQNVRSIRPGFGLPPKHLMQIIGKEAACQIEKGTPLNWKLVKND
ncbi:MAG: pseudaminic acid synthase [Patescibacteria group bacterium]